MGRARLIQALLAVASLFSTAAALAAVDSQVPEYARVSGISGNLSSAGSDTLANLMTLWAEDFTRLYPNVNIQVQAAGSSTAPPALTERTANIGPMSREMKGNEIQAFESRYGYPPTAIPVAIDALAIYVHKDNPVSGMTLAQVDAVYSSTLRCGHPNPVTTWGDLDMEGSWEQRRIQLFGRNSVSGTYGFFKEAGLCNGDFRNNVNEQPGSGSVVQSVATAINGIGYSGIGYQTSSVRAIPVSRSAGEGFIEATRENSIAGDYPLARFLLVYINKEPNTPLPPLEREFIRLILSRSGQNSVLKDGYIPLPAPVIVSTLRTLGIE